MIVRSQTRTHSTSVEVREELRARLDAGGLEGPRGTGRAISDGAALAIASWWQGPVRGDGAAFAELASTGQADMVSLLGDISAALRSIADAPHAYPDEDQLFLGALFAWVTVKVAQGS